MEELAKNAEIQDAQPSEMEQEQEGTPVEEEATELTEEELEEKAAKRVLDSVKEGKPRLLYGDGQSGGKKW